MAAATAAGVVALLFCSGCGATTPPAPYEERLQYLRTVAGRGAETHALMAAQEAAIDRERCSAAYAGLSDEHPPNDRPRGGLTGTADWGVSREWAQQVEVFFVDSCVSGKPRPVAPGDASSTPAPTTTAVPG